MTNKNAAPERISHERAMEAAQRFIRAFFNNEGKKPEIQIPCRPDKDDDCVLVEYIKQQMQPPASESDEAVLEQLYALIMAYHTKGNTRPWCDVEKDLLAILARHRASADSNVRALREALEKVLWHIDEGGLAPQEGAVDYATHATNGRQIDPMRLAPAILKWNAGCADVGNIVKQALAQTKEGE